MVKKLNKKLDEFKKYIKSKNVAVIGLGISNTPLVKYLCNLGVGVTVFDRAAKEDVKDKIEMFEGFNVKFSLGKDYLSLLKGFDIIFKTPIVRPDIPELQEERARGAIVTSEMEVFVDLCPAEIFAVTGSDGKTTTTTLLYNILKETGFKCWLGGNIGMPLLDKIDEITANDKVVLELSSFQLHTMSKSPDISIVTNLSENHLDVHKSMNEYVEAKKNIFKFQNENNTVVLNYDNQITKIFAEQAKSNVMLFSRLNDIKIGATVVDGMVVYKNGEKTVPIVKVDDILLLGEHNVENYLAVVAATIKYTSPDVINKVATTFGTVEHRIEFVRELNGVKFYNDSIGTSPTRTIASVKSFKQKVILIAGGYDKKISYQPMGKICIEKVKGLVLMGQTAPIIQNVVVDEMSKHEEIKIPIVNVDSLESAVKKAYEMANDGDIVILSPASASFDMFKNFEVRGNEFKKLVYRL